MLAKVPSAYVTQPQCIDAYLWGLPDPCKTLVYGVDQTLPPLPVEDWQHQTRGFSAYTSIHNI